MERSEICRYCGGVIRLVPARAVYGSAVKRLGLEKEYIYQCQNCNARVGCHKGTTRPLGHVANETLRLKRMETHQVFDAGLGNNAFLHRFLNGANVEYSAIYQDGEEVWNCERGHEADMLKSWKESEIH